MKDERSSSSRWLSRHCVVLVAGCVAAFGCVDFDNNDPVVAQAGDGVLGLANTTTDQAYTAQIVGEGSTITNAVMDTLPVTVNVTNAPMDGADPVITMQNAEVPITNQVVEVIPGQSRSADVPPNQQVEVSLPAGLYTVTVSGGGRTGSLAVTISANQLTRLRIARDSRSPTALALSVAN